MYIKFFVEAKDVNEALQLVEDSLSDMEKEAIVNGSESSNPYWKMQNVHIVEMRIDLNQDLLITFLNKFSDKWLEFGEPVDELLASKNNKDCKFMKEKFELINIFF